MQRNGLHGNGLKAKLKRILVGQQPTVIRKFCPKSRDWVWEDQRNPCRYCMIFQAGEPQRPFDDVD